MLPNFLQLYFIIVPNKLECLNMAGRPFQPSLMFVGEPGSLTSLEHIRGASIGSLTQRNYCKSCRGCHDTEHNDT